MGIWNQKTNAPFLSGRTSTGSIEPENVWEGQGYKRDPPEQGIGPHLVIHLISDSHLVVQSFERSSG